MESKSCDVVIIGAGLSGLSAAYYLVKRDRSLRVKVLEAKDRIGGRTFTKQLRAADETKDFWDLGGEWIGRPQPHLHYLIQKFDLNPFQPVPATSAIQTYASNNLSWAVRIDLWVFKWKLKSMKTKLKSSFNASRLRSLSDDIIMESFMEDVLWTQEAKSLVRTACHCMFGIMTSEMTLCFFLMNVDMAGGLDTLIDPGQFGGGEFRLKGGLQQLSHQLVAKIGKSRVLTSQPVTSIVQSIEGAHVRTLKGLHLICQRVIIAVPPHHAASIEYSPSLPPAKIDLMKSIPLAFFIKFTITYETAFWRHTKNSQSRGFQAVLEDGQVGQIGLVYEATSGRGNPALSGFISHADKIHPDPQNRRYLILSLVEQIVGPNCHNLLEFSLLDWSLEPYNGGCFLKNFIPDTFRFRNSEIREPFDRIHFGGTETATVWCGFMNGAVQAGFRVASEVMFHLRPKLPPSAFPETKADDKPTAVQAPKKSSSLPWLAAGVGVVSLLYLIARSSRVSRMGDTFVRDILLVFDP